MSEKNHSLYEWNKTPEMGNAEINTINIILTLYKMMCNTNVLLAASWFQPQPAGRRQRGMFERHTQYRLKSEQKKKKKRSIKRSETTCFSLFILKYREGPADFKQNNPAGAKRHTWKSQIDGRECLWWRTSVNVPLTALGFLLTFMSNLKQKQRQTLTKKKQQKKQTWIWWKTLVPNQSTTTKKQTERNDTTMIPWHPAGTAAASGVWDKNARASNKTGHGEKRTCSVMAGWTAGWQADS